MKTLIIIAITTNSIAHCYSQEKQSITFSWYGGINFSKANSTVANDQGIRVGFQTGGLLQLPISQKIRFVPEIGYWMQGAKSYYQTSSANSNGMTQSVLNLLNLSLLVERGNRVKIHAGPQVGLILSAKEKGTIGQLKVDQSLTKDMTRFELSAMMGGLFAITKKIDLGFRYKHGLNDLYKSDNPSTIVPDVKFRVAQLYLRYNLSRPD